MLEHDTDELQVDAGPRDGRANDEAGDIITAAEELCGRRITVEHRPPAREPHTAVADTSLIRTELGWRPSRRSSITQILIPFAPR
jgi:nucleoside-diphosphate-sugar epimerase